jgi:hypothetical protein
MENVAQAIRQGQGAAAGAASITVEKHKNNFLTQYGTFEDKDSQNITRWLGKADVYQAAHMIESLEMGSIVIHCIRGDPARKVRRMLDVPGLNYVHSDHYSQQEEQVAVAYQPYRERREAGVAPDLIPEGKPNAGAVNPDAGEELEMRPARSAILPVRFQPFVAADHCLKHYLLTLYAKRVNLAEAEKFLNTFKTQKPKQTCSNYLDEFVINYENYAHMKWTPQQLNGIPAVIALPNAVLAIPAADAVPGNQPARDADMLQLLTDGICKEFRIHCDNIGFDLTATNFPALEIAVQTWQRSSTTGKQFTAGCLPASQGNKNVNVSSLEIKDQWEEDNEKLAIMDAQTNSYQVSLASARGQRGGRGGRGAGRGARGRGAPTGMGTQGSNQKTSVQSRDLQDGGYHNYRQSQDGTLHKSIHGHPL